MNRLSKAKRDAKFDEAIQTALRQFDELTLQEARNLGLGTSAELTKILEPIMFAARPEDRIEACLLEIYFALVDLAGGRKSMPGSRESRTGTRYVLADYTSAPAATFELPDDKERMSVPVGSLVRLNFDDAKGKERSERMWVVVREAREDGTYSGKLKNSPVLLDLNWGEEITFSWFNIIGIRTEAENDDLENSVAVLGPDGKQRLTIRCKSGSPAFNMAEMLTAHRFVLTICSAGTVAFTPIECSGAATLEEQERGGDREFIATKISNVAEAIKGMKGLNKDRKRLRDLAQKVREGAEPAFLPSANGMEPATNGESLDN